MIQNSELRIGNKLLFGFNKKPDQIVTVAWLSSDSIGYAEQHEASYPQSPKNFEPIPLTYTIMERAGFITMDYEIDVIVWAREDTQYIFMLSQNGIPVNDQPIVFEYEVDYEIQKAVKWVHELQNLYFILCGVELEINL